MDCFETYSTVAGLSREAPPAFAAPAPGVSRAAPAGVYSGALGYGGGGPVWLDANHSKRPPTPPELVNAVKGVSYSCIKLNAVGVAKVPLRLYAVRRPGQRPPRRSFRTAPDKAQKRIRFGSLERGTVGPGLARSIDSHDEIDEILDHDLIGALEKPNEFFDRPTFLMYLSACLDSVGQAFVFPTRPYGADGLADPSYAATELWPLQAQYVFPGKGTAGELVREWRYFGDSYASKELVRVRWFSVRDPYLSGYAPLHACYEQTSLVDFYTADVEATLKNGARPDFLVGSKDPLHRFGPGERERFERDINKQHSGARRGKAWVVDGAFDVHALNYPLADLGALQLSKEMRLLCANCFDVPISLLQSEDSNRATAQESTHQHQYYGIDPRCCLIASALTGQLAQPIDDRLFFYFDDPVSRDVEREAKVWAMKVSAGQATLNEWRADDGLPPVENGDSNRIPNNSTAINGPDAEAARAAAEAAAEATAPAGDDQVVAGQPADGETKAAEAEAEAARSAALTDRILSTLDTLNRSLANDPRNDEPGAGDAGPWAGGAGPE